MSNLNLFLANIIILGIINLVLVVVNNVYSSFAENRTKSILS